MSRNSIRAQPRFAFSMRLGVRNHSDTGFSMVELMIVVGVSLVIAGMAVPSVMRAIYNVRLRSSASSLSGLLQNARMTAVKTNTTLPVHFTPLGTSTAAYIDTSVPPNGTFDPGEPMVQLGGNITVMETPTGTGAPPQLDAAALGFTNSQADPTFNSRGVPIVPSASPFLPAGFVYYLQDTRSGGDGWAAVSITPGGRIKTWSWNGGAWTN